MRALIYHLPLGEMDGTSVVLRRIYEPEAASVRQPYFRTGRFPVPSEFSAEYIQGIVNWPWEKGARFMRRNWARLALPSLMRRSRLITQLRNAAQRNSLTSVHVVIYDEQTAGFARTALKTIGARSFTLHVMDLLLDEQISPSSSPNLCWLLARANNVAVVSNLLGETLRPFTPAHIWTWPIPAGFHAHDRLSPPDASAATPWQVLLGGAIYAGKTGFLEEVFIPAWKQFQQTHPNTELVYVGKDIEGIPPAVRACLRPLGVVPKEKIAETLRSASVAVLPILHEASTPWRYSIPARLSDYLAAGLPVIAPLSEGTATDDFLQEVGSPAITLVSQQADVLAALQRLHDSPFQWLAASHAASAYAREHLDLQKLRAQLFNFVAVQPGAELAAG